MYQNQDVEKALDTAINMMQKNAELTNNISNPLEPQGSWEEVKKNFINELVALVYKHFDCTVQCEDCGGFLLHICEKAFREWNSTFFDKVRTEAIKEERGKFNTNELEKDWENSFYESSWHPDTLNLTKTEKDIIEELTTFLPRHMNVYDWNLPYADEIILIIHRPIVTGKQIGRAHV